MATGKDFDRQLPDTVKIEDLSKLECQPCHTDGIIRLAVGLCTDCQECLCRNCFDGHNLPKHMENHQLFKKQQILKSLQRKEVCSQNCSRHDDEVITYYCIAHEKLGCSICLNLDHRTCKPVHYIPDAALNLDNNAEFKRTELCLNTALKLCKKVFDAGAHTVDSIETSCTEALESVEKHKRDINDALDKIQTAIVKKAETMEARAVDQITNITEQFRDAQRELQEFQTRTEQLKGRQQNCDLYTEMMHMKNRLTALECDLKKAEMKLSLQATQIKFTPNLQLLDLLKSQKLFGKLAGTEIRIECIMEVEHVKDIDVKTANETNICSITGSTFLTDSKLVIADQDNRSVKTVDVQQHRVIAQAMFSSPPWDVCTIKVDQVAVTFPVARQIVLVKLNDSLSIDGTIIVDGECVGVDYKDGKLAVSFYSKPYKVQIINLEGAVLHEIKTDQEGYQLFNYPWHVQFDKNGSTVYVTNYWSDEVVRVKFDGTRIATYTNSELARPTGIVLDNDGNVYVCGWDSHNIHQISPDCRKLRVILGPTNDLKYPYSISYRKRDDTFCVGSITNNSIKVYESSLVGLT